MPDKCCVPACTGNYDAASGRPRDKVSIFQFPADPALRDKWYKSIPRNPEDYKNNKRPPVVCEKHFAAEFIVREDKVTRSDGTILSLLRKRPKLTKNAYPTIFPSTPSYLSSEPPRRRKMPITRRQEMSECDEQESNDLSGSDSTETFDEMSDKIDASDRIETFEEMSEKIDDFLKRYLESKWIIKHLKDCVCIGLTDFDDVPRFTIFVRVRNDLSVDVYKGQVRVSKQSLQRILGKDNKLYCWSQLNSLISHFDADSTDAAFTVNDQVALVEQVLTELHNLVNDSGDYDADVADRLQFLSEQISLLFMKQKRYSCVNISIAFRFFAVSLSVYNRLRDSILTLPNVSYLKRLSSVLSVSGGLSDSDSHVTYLRQKAELIQPRERHVILLLDEINVQPRATYKDGRVIGMAVNSTLEQATTVRTFMLCSLLSANKDVAALVPVKNLTAENLKQYTLQVIGMLEKCGYFVFCLVSDNNRVNRNMFTELCGESLVPYIKHPCAADRKLFLLFNTAHLLKCIRDDWLSQSDVDNTLIFPNFTEDGTCQASLSLLRQLYDSEKDCSVKQAPALTYSALNPTNIERQNVKLALKIFDEKNIPALENFGSQSDADVKGTVRFIQIIGSLWKIFNVKAMDKGRHKRDSFSNPIKAVDCEQIKFLKNIQKWLEDWEALNQKSRQGRLSDETMFALKHTAVTLVELVVYLFNDLHLSSILFGKFETESLEYRFCLYRRLSGTNYHVSVRELRESEKKLNIVSTLHVTSASRGKISLRDLLAANEKDEADGEDTDVASFVDALSMCDDVAISDAEAAALVFVAGYVGFKAQRKINCDMCKSELLCDKILHYDISSADFAYLSEIVHGELCWPTDFLLEVVTQVFVVFQALISKDFETNFLTVNNQRSLLRSLSVERLIECGVVVGECTCGVQMVHLAEICLSDIVNICLNNYCKRAANRTHSNKTKSKVQSKVSTYRK
jgi:hypothetical protein